jgi:DNA-binding XRE family transcriptional regulator
MWDSALNHLNGGDGMTSTATERSKRFLDVDGNRIRALRERKQWSQLTLSCNAGVTQCTISRLESGRLTHARPATLQRLAGALEAPIESVTCEAPAC